MNILLFSMPDSFEHTPTLTMRMPNGALASLAGNVDAHHHVAVADLVLAQRDVPGTIERLLSKHLPDVVGLSVMTFQRKTAFKVIALVRACCPGITIVVGGYDPSLAPEEYESPALGVDFIVRGEGEHTFRELIRSLEGDRDMARIEGLSHRVHGRLVHNRARPVSRLGEDVRPPNRNVRALSGYTFLGRPVDIVETSRGCTYDCSFCSIIEMRGRNFHTWSVERAVADIADARDHGARVIFIVDDNISLNVARFKALCEAITAAKLNTLDFIVQAMTSAVASGGDDLAEAMRRAGFRYVFLGIENVLAEDLTFLRASAKNAQRVGGRTTGSATVRAVDLLHRHGMFVVGGLIVGNPSDTEASIETNLAFARRYVDWPYIQHPTPYPGTPMSKDFNDRNLIVTRNVEEYDGTTAVVRSETLGPEDIEFLRWRAERWMKVRHLPVVVRHDPAFVAQHGLAMLRHTFRGARWRTWLGLEPERDAYRRYRRLRQTEREFFPVTVDRPQADLQAADPGGRRLS